MDFPNSGTRGVIRFQNFLKIIGKSFFNFLFLILFVEFIHLFKIYVFTLRLIRSCKINRTVAIDMRGFGWSERPIGEKNYMLPNLIGDLKALIKYLSE